MPAAEATKISDRLLRFVYHKDKLKTGCRSNS
jgi:hypothetical protein